MEVLREEYAIPFRMPPPLSPTPIILDSYSPQSVKGRALDEEIQALHRKGAVEPAPPTSSFFSRMFVVTKATGGWRPIIDLTTLNLNVDRTPFRMETSQTVLRAVRRNDWMVSIDLKDAYLQIPIHPALRRFLRFTAGGKTWQFRVLCFCLCTAPQVFTHVMAPVSGFLHQLGRRDLVSGLERGSPVHSVLGRAVEHYPDASVCSREEQCGGRCAVSPRPGTRLGVDAPSGCVQLALPALAGDNLSVTVALFILRWCWIPWLRVRMPCSSHGIRYRRMPSLRSP